MALNPKFSFSEGQIKLHFDGWKLAYVIQAVLHSSPQSAWALVLLIMTTVKKNNKKNNPKKLRAPSAK